MPTNVSISLQLILLAALVGGCNQVDPEDDDPNADDDGDDSRGESGSDAGGTDTNGSMPDHYPLVDGARWVYRHTSMTKPTWDEIAELEATEYEGQAAWALNDNEDLAGERTTSILVRSGTKVLRIHSETTIAGEVNTRTDYIPGFLRYDEAWKQGDVVTETYERVELAMDGSVLETETREQTYEIESMSVEVEVDAGTFDCVQVRRRRPDTGAQTRIWFADGVGKVKDLDLIDGDAEELTEYDIP